MKEVKLKTYFGDEVVFEYEGKEEILLSVNHADFGALTKDDIVELIGFLSNFVDGDI